MGLERSVQPNILNKVNTCKAASWGSLNPLCLSPSSQPSQAAVLCLTPA